MNPHKPPIAPHPPDGNLTTPDVWEMLTGPEIPDDELIEVILFIPSSTCSSLQSCITGHESSIDSAFLS